MFLIIKSCSLIVGGACRAVRVVVGEALALLIQVISSVKEVLLKLLEFAHFDQKSRCDETKVEKFQLYFDES